MLTLASGGGKQSKPLQKDFSRSAMLRHTVIIHASNTQALKPAVGSHSHSTSPAIHFSTSVTELNSTAPLRTGTTQPLSLHTVCTQSKIAYPLPGSFFPLPHIWALLIATHLLTTPNRLLISVLQQQPSLALYRGHEKVNTKWIYCQGNRLWEIQESIPGLHGLQEHF